MPYKSEKSSKSSYIDIVKNPDVKEFLSECRYLEKPSDDTVEEIKSMFFGVDIDLDSLDMPDRIIAIDGSLHEASIDDKLPSTKLGYIKIGTVLILLKDYNSLRVSDGRHVDPFRVAKLQDKSDPVTFTLPSANIKWKDYETAKKSFRAAVDSLLLDKRTRFKEDDYMTSLRATLFYLASKRTGELGTGDPNRLKIHHCPNEGCYEKEIEVKNIEEKQFCPKCGQELFPSDCLRLWEEVEEHQSNYGALTSFMELLEHLFMIHYIRWMHKESLDKLSNTAFFLDGPLAIFRTAAWLHAPILKMINEVQDDLVEEGLDKFVLIGLQKNGQIADHIDLIDDYIPKENSFFPINDLYRHKYIFRSSSVRRFGFGSETYYGQDFILRTSSGRTFGFSLPYPFKDKNISDFHKKEKLDINNYPEFFKAIKIIKYFESDLYKNAVVPVALAHKHTSISMKPGGEILNAITKESLNSED